MDESSQQNQNVDKLPDISQMEGDQVRGDKITVGDVTNSYAAIGAGAQVIVNQVQEALSAVDEMEKSIQAAERRLAESIQRKITDISKFTFTDVESRGNPYKALLDYKTEDAPFFYGRAEAIYAMQQKMQQSRLTILHSDSGSGKTSLLQAGLASRLLVDGQFPLYLRPYAQAPGQTIKKSFLPDYATQEELSHFRDEQMTLFGFLERVTHYLGARRLIIFLDQFEEFFTELAPDKQGDFTAQLRECVESDLPVWWVLALHKEYFSDLRLFLALKPFENEYFLPTFNVEEAREVIVEPAAQKGVVYEAGLVNQILADIRQQSKVIPPAQVQLVCYTLFDELPAEDDPALITYTLYNKPRGRREGTGAEGILSSHLSRVLDRELKGQERKVAGRVLEALVTSDVRRVVRSRESLQNVVEQEQVVLLDDVLNVLFENRLVRRELDENDQPVYELAHDYLLSEIELDPETQARKATQELLNQEVHAYQQHSTLLSKDKFDIINSQRDTLQIDATAAELLDMSEATLEAERRRELEQAQKLVEEQRLRAEEGEKAAHDLRRRLILTTVAVVIALLAFVTATWFGMDANNQRDIAGIQAVKATVAQGQAEIEAQNAMDAQATAEANEIEANLNAYAAATSESKAQIARKEAETERDRADQAAQIARARELAALARSVLEESPQRALLLAVEAVRTSDPRVPAAEEVLRFILEQTGGQKFAPSNSSPPDTNGWRRNRTIQAGPDDRWLTMVDDRSMYLYSMDDGPMLRQSRPLDEEAHWTVRNVFSPDGIRLIAIKYEDRSRLWDLTAEPLNSIPLQGPLETLWQVSFSANGQWLAGLTGNFYEELWDWTVLSPETISYGSNPTGSGIDTDDHALYIWDLHNNGNPLRLEGHEADVTDFEQSASRRYLLSQK